MFKKKSEYQNQNLVLSTTTKRKLLVDETVQNLIGIFDGVKTTTPLGGGAEESPAKQRLICRNSGGR